MKYAVFPVPKTMAAARQAGMLHDSHPDECPCRKCRRMRAAVARRQKPRYGQTQP
jgi:hypothetical protein